MGVSKETFEKQEMFRTIIRAHIAIVGAIQAKRDIKKPYVYIDAFADCGEYRSKKWGEPIIGSPLIFLQEAERLKIPYRAYAIEEDKELANILLKTSPKYGKLNVICGDNRKELFTIDVQYGDFGMLYADPKGNCPNLPILNEIFQYWCINMVFNRLSATQN